MKHFNTLFDIFLYEGIFIFFFSSLLFVLNDPYSDTLLLIGTALIILAAALGITGHLFNLFTKENRYEES